MGRCQNVKSLSTRLFGSTAFNGAPAESVFENPSEHITVKEVLPTFVEAESEAQRLNELNQDKHCVYFATPSRFFPNGR